MSEQATSERQFYDALCLAASGDHERAAAGFLECVIADPGCGEFVREFLANLERAAKTAEVKALSLASEVEKKVQRAIAEAHWPGVLRYGPRLLASQPQHVPTLLALADACEAQRHGEAEACYLRAALQAAGGDVKVLRRAGLGFARLKQFDESIACWRKLEALDPSDEQPAGMIVTLTIASSRRRAGLPGADDSANDSVDARGGGRRVEKVKKFVIGNLEALTASATHPSGLALNPVQQLEAAIRERPSVPELYLRLAQLYLDKDREYDAERLLAKGREATDRDARVQHMWEDVTMLRDARRVEIAEQEVNGADNPQTRAALADAIKERDRVETDIFLSRCKREPESPEIQYQLGMRLMRAERIDEACQFFEKAQASRDHRAAAELRLGECFEKRGDVAGALHHYRASAEAAMGTYRIEEQKESLYRAGKLALRIKLAILAERYLVQLLRIDPNHREAAVLMQRI